MILNGNQRGGGLKLAAHLSNLIENDHVDLHDIRGFVSDTLRGALQEAEAVAKGTQCPQFLFSLSLNPPETEKVSILEFEEAVDAAEKKLGLTGQPRAIVFHEKNGRRHAHAVWSRIDASSMKAINLPFYHQRLTELSKDLFLKHGWRLPDGLRDHGNRDPRNFDLAEWQQAKRAGKNAREIKRVFQEAWQVSDTGQAFAAALEEKGYFIARGNRRRVVAVDAMGEVFAVPKWTAQKATDVRVKIGDPKALRSVDETKAHISALMRPTLSKWAKDLRAQVEEANRKAKAARESLVAQQRQERKKLKEKLADRARAEAHERQSRFRRGLGGVWDRIRGANRKIQRENEAAAWEARRRDQVQTDALIFQHLEIRRAIKQQHAMEARQIRARRNALLAERQHFRDIRSPGVAQDGPALR